ncbi:UPF0280 family protein [Curvibacter sp. HBC28]|uniref:UPF0280 family protein n=1 Tax=Curvibacter microcysteis TaxID=3026419 RepID=A0ABT5MBB6_9BURK|nr:UPF0280 family protein [Curvibacter sp. HBC28]MDD0813863.1 UPF0280 family protein [Curvibacter sp. HBC28]
MHATRHLLPDARWHFQHGPIDLVIGAEGDAPALAAAHERAWQRFEQVLPELVAELPTLRQPVGTHCALQGPVARRMWQACLPFAPQQFITPMAAVAGAVAQEIVAAYAVPGVRRAWVNNGGDIALHLQPGQRARIGLFADLARLDLPQLRQGLQLDGQFELPAEWPVRGVATSGWRGRSHSLGIADSVTVLAATAAQADAAATVIANAVNVDHPGIERRPAGELRDDSDLGSIPVTVAVPPLPEALLRQALHRGLKKAEELRAAGLVWFALLSCQQQVLSTEHPGALSRPENSPAPWLKNEVGSVFA